MDRYGNGVLAPQWDGAWQGGPWCMLGLGGGGGLLGTGACWVGGGAVHGGRGWLASAQEIVGGRERSRGFQCNLGDLFHAVPRFAFWERWSSLALMHAGNVGETTVRSACWEPRGPAPGPVARWE